MKFVAIHQPNFLPWQGYFSKMALADVFIILDDVEYSKNSYINRVKIKASNGTPYLTVPVLYSGNSGARINEIGIANPATLKKHWRSLESNYRRAAHWVEISKVLGPIFDQEESSLCRLNLKLLRAVRDLLGLDVEFVLSSDLAVEGNKAARVANLTRAVNGTTYISGQGASSYNDMDLFKTQGLALAYTDYNLSSHKQLWGDFVGGLSIVDSLFNLGVYEAAVSVRQATLRMV